MVRRKLDLVDEIVPRRAFRYVENATGWLGGFAHLETHFPVMTNQGSLLGEDLLHRVLKQEACSVEGDKGASNPS